MNSQKNNIHIISPLTLISTNHLLSNSPSIIKKTKNTIIIRKKTNPYFRNNISRPRSTPSSKHYQTIKNNPILSNFEYYSTKHKNPLTLTPPKSNPYNPPTTITIIKSTTIPYYTTKNHSIQNYKKLSTKNQQYFPIQYNDKQKQTKLKKNHSKKNFHNKHNSSHNAKNNKHNIKRLSTTIYNTTPKTKHKPHRINLPTSLSYITSYPKTTTSNFYNKSINSTYSISSNRTTPIVIPSTPIIPTNNNKPTLTFNFNNPLTSTNNSLNK